MDLKVRLKEEKINILTEFDLGGASTLKCGGKVRYIAYPTSAEEASILIKTARECNYKSYITGSLSNILVQDGLLDYLVISTQNLKGIVIKGDLVTAYAGEKLDQVINRAIEHNLIGLEKLGGIPGTIGGAVVGNAGANGVQTSDNFFYADYLDKNGNIARMPAYSDSFGYRSSPFTNEMFVVSASFRLKPSRYSAEARKQKEEYIRKRKEMGQYRYPSLGCFFKNPEGESAGALIDRCGLKGLHVNDATVSNDHAAFLINRGKATANDIYTLSKLVKAKVKEETGIELEYEVKFLGDFKE